MTKLNFFKKALSGVLIQRDPKWAQSKVSQVLWKMYMWNVSDFLHQLQQHKVFKSIFIIFWKRSCFEVFGPKRGQNRPKMSFFKFHEKLCKVLCKVTLALRLKFHVNFFFTYFLEFFFFFWGFGIKSSPKWAQDEVFQVFQKAKHEIFAGSYSSMKN